MDFLYCTFLLTFLIFPFAGMILCRYFPIDRGLHMIKPIASLFLLHNALFFLGFSLKGDFADYLIFSVEYLFLCYLAFALKSKNIYIKIFKVLGTVGISFGIVMGGVGTLMFVVVEQDYEANKIFHFQNSNDKYETRRYTFGFATLEHTRYTFETYREYSYLPFEIKIDKTNFFDDKTNLNIDEDSLEIVVQTSGDKRQILFKDQQGNVFSKLVN